MFSIFNKRTKPNPKVLDEPAQFGKRSNNEEHVDDPCYSVEKVNTNSESNKDTFTPLVSTNITVSKNYKYFFYQL